MGSKITSFNLDEKAIRKLELEATKHNMSRSAYMEKLILERIDENIQLMRQIRDTLTRLESKE